MQPLDRDYPNGSELWQVLISAVDEGDLSTLTEVWITLTDVNDNAPFLRMVSDAPSRLTFFFFLFYATIDVFDFCFFFWFRTLRWYGERIKVRVI